MKIFSSTLSAKVVKIKKRKTIFHLKLFSSAPRFWPGCIFLSFFLTPEWHWRILILMHFVRLFSNVLVYRFLGEMSVNISIFRDKLLQKKLNQRLVNFILAIFCLMFLEKFGSWPSFYDKFNPNQVFLNGLNLYSTLLPFKRINVLLSDFNYLKLLWLLVTFVRLSSSTK